MKDIKRNVPVKAFPEEMPIPPFSPEMPMDVIPDEMPGRNGHDMEEDDPTFEQKWNFL